MTSSNRTTFVAVAAALLATAAAHAGIVVSNLDEASDMFPSFSGNVWRATSFTTDAQAYTLDTITARLAPQGIFPAVAVPRLFLDASGVPSGAALETFASQGITTSGEYTFISTGLLLDPNTTYWLAFQGQDPGQTTWAATNSITQSGIWMIGDVMLRSSDSGSTWTQTDTFVGKFSIAATPVPEPSPLVLTLAGLACVAAWRLCPKVSAST
jgi:hypothetical protein